ncbi:MAG: hypothetical protein WA323_04550 [Candidatus Nitrosopolaris sp.]
MCDRKIRQGLWQFLRSRNRCRGSGYCNIAAYTIICWRILHSRTCVADSLTPGQFESQAVENFGPLAKYSAFAGAIIIYFILYGLFAVLLIRLHDKLHWEGYVRRAILASVVAYLILLILAITLITITEARTHTQATSVTRLVVSFILPQIAFGFTLSSFSVKIRRASRKP